MRTTMNPTRSILIVTLTLGVTLGLTACQRGDGQITTLNARIPAAPPGAGVMAGYLDLRNGTQQALRCDAVSGPDFGAAEIHRTVVEDGQSRMLREQIVEAVPGATVSLAPGGLHLMLFRPQRELRAGDQTVLTLRCGDTAVSATFQIQDLH